MKDQERLSAVLAVKAGESVDAVAARHDLMPGSVRNWIRQYEQKGATGLAALKRGPKQEKWEKAKREHPQEFEQKLRGSARDAWLWLNNECKIAVTITTVYNWKKKLGYQ